MSRHSTIRNINPSPVQETRRFSSHLKHYHVSSSSSESQVQDLSSANGYKRVKYREANNAKGASENTVLKFIGALFLFALALFALLKAMG